MGNNINTKLWDAARDGDEATVRQCIEAGATVDWRDEDGWTALHQAAKYGHSTVVRLLMNAGWSLWARNNHGRTPLSYIDTKLWDAARDGEEATVRQCIEAGATVDWRRDGVTALHWATKYGHTNVARLLVDAGWSLEARNMIGGTPLHMAAVTGKLETVKYLLLRGAHIDYQDGHKETPLHGACRGSYPAYKGQTDVVRHLLMAGAN